MESEDKESARSVGGLVSKGLVGREELPLSIGISSSSSSGGGSISVKIWS